MHLTKFSINDVFILSDIHRHKHGKLVLSEHETSRHNVFIGHKIDMTRIPHKRDKPDNSVNEYKELNVGSILQPNSN